MEFKWGYQLTQKADADLDGIVEYIAVKLANPKVASDFVNKLKDVIEEAWDFPESGALVVNEFISDMQVRKKLVGNYILYYLPDFTNKIIFVLRIVYGRQNMDEILRKINE